MFPSLWSTCKTCISHSLKLSKLVQIHLMVISHHQRALAFGHSKNRCDRVPEASHQCTHLLLFSRWCSASMSPVGRALCRSFHIKSKFFGGNEIDQRNFQKGFSGDGFLSKHILKPAFVVYAPLGSPDQIIES